MYMERKRVRAGAAGRGKPLRGSPALPARARPRPRRGADKKEETSMRRTWTRWLAGLMTAVMLLSALPKVEPLRPFIPEKRLSVLAR